MRITVWGPLGHGGFEAHAVGCRDNDKIARRVSSELAETIDVDTRYELVDSFYGPGAGSYYFESGYGPEGYLGEFDFKPCLAGLPVGEPINVPDFEGEDG